MYMCAFAFVLQRQLTPVATRSWNAAVERRAVGFDEANDTLRTDFPLTCSLCSA
jgi:hypothetical protein